MPDGVLALGHGDSRAHRHSATGKERHVPQIQTARAQTFAARDCPLATAAVLAGTGLTATSAQAATTPGWSIAEVYGSAAGYPDLQAVAASGQSDAWVSGSSFGDLVIYQWNGTTWTASGSIPSEFESPQTVGDVNDSVIGASSANNMWTFPDISTSTGITYDALQWDNGTWNTFTLNGTEGILGTAVFGPADAWAFGQAPTTNQGLGYGAPYAIRYNGHAWRHVSMPGTAALGVSPLAPDDIWAFGPTAATAGLTNQDMVAMHWNGRSWSTLQIPLYQIGGDQAIVQRGVALGRDDVWVSEGLPVNLGSGQIEGPGIVLAHWNGHTWKEVINDTAYSWQGGPTSDGHGGLWLQGVPAEAGADVFLHYHAGTLTAVAEPALTGYTTGVSGMALVPGTRSIWATAGVTPTGGATEGAILAYTP
jgi:hypothetical protein